MSLPPPYISFHHRINSEWISLSSVCGRYPFQLLQVVYLSYNKTPIFNVYKAFRVAYVRWPMRRREWRVMESFPTRSSGKVNELVCLAVRGENEKPHWRRVTQLLREGFVRCCLHIRLHRTCWSSSLRFVFLRDVLPSHRMVKSAAFWISGVYLGSAVHRRRDPCSGLCSERNVLDWLHSQNRAHGDCDGQRHRSFRWLYNRWTDSAIESRHDNVKKCYLLISTGHCDHSF